MLINYFLDTFFEINRTPSKLSFRLYDEDERMNKIEKKKIQFF